MASITIRYPAKLPSASNLREHHFTRARRVKRQRKDMHLRWLEQVRGKRLPPFPLVVTMTRVAPTTLDDDNLASAFKGCRDQVAAELGIDDRDPRVTWVCAQRKGRGRRKENGRTVPADWAIEVRIEAREEKAA